MRSFNLFHIVHCSSILFFLFITGFFPLQAQITEARILYIEKYKELAISEMKRTGIPASITLAQGLLESDNGNSRLARKANNHFGIKCHDSWEGGRIYHDDDAKGECFRRYKSVYDSYKDHSHFLTKASRYAFLFELKPDDYKRWARGLKKAGYATDPTYARRLIKIIEENELYKYDGDYDEDKDLFYTVKQTEKPHEIRTVNRRDYIIAKEGDTYIDIAKTYEMMKWEVYKYNDLPKDADITPGQRIFIQPKRNKAARGNKFHYVKEGETMYTISQQYAIKLKKLYKRNDMNPGEPIEPGQKIWLRVRKPFQDDEDGDDSFRIEFNPE